MLSTRSGKPREKNKISLTSLLTGLVTLAVLLTSTILLIASYESKKQSLIETTMHLNYSKAARISHTMDSLFQSMQSSLEYNAGVLANSGTMLPEEVDRYLEVLRNSSNYFNSISLVNADGVVRNVAPTTLKTAGKKLTSKAGLEALALKAPFISAPYMTSTTNRLIVFMSEPLISRDGLYLGILAGTLYLQENNVMNLMFGNGGIDEMGSYYYIVDSDGHLLFHPDITRIGEDVSSSKVVQKLMDRQSGEQQTLSSRGAEVLTGYSSVPANGWGVVVVSPADVMHKQLVSHLRTIIWYTLLPFMVLLLGVILLARRLAEPFVSLADLVNKVGKEKVKLPSVKPHWNREADLLTNAVYLAVSNIQKHTDQLTQEAATDPLTGLLNRRTLELTLKEWIVQEHPFSLIVIDVDKFKFVNDTYGHLTGDQVLRHVARMISSSMRPDDVCCRYGGEEFVILLSRTKAEDAFIVAERVRTAVENSNAPIPTRVTVSQGIAHYPTHAGSREELLEKADQALYLAKSSGRNRTVAAE
ncbi:GGDEF domain-containing protein [Paenibacillus albidus]|uniref:sensor domain-containing diguanylate cyclase n=1 Tax=Paenibacillus albidus TaxID=2041023 RepID=UPI001BE4E95D|nr:sensor domain-containing diguanylate cyclase [Paenibacillus albidus]MBT2291123.1 GGDEF domain-containing protein [Paenibacillus albidus]